MRVIDLGRMGYEAAWDVQREVAELVLSGAEDALLVVEHDPVLTLGAAFQESNLLLPADEYRSRGIDVVRTDRGGDVTYHGPGQLVVYPVFDLNRHGRDLHRWMRGLEEAVILAVGEFGLAGWRFPPHTGVWVGDPGTGARKVAAIGVKVRRWVNLHGVALNCDADLSPFGLIVPCGIQGFGVTSIAQETGRTVTVEDAKAPIERAFRATFPG